MTIILSVNFGDIIYLASDSVMTVRDNKSGKFRAVGHRIKVYRLGDYHAAVAFSGPLTVAQKTLGSIRAYAQSQEAVNEEELYLKIPGILRGSLEALSGEFKDNAEVFFAGLQPGSKEYDQEKFPGTGIPPKSFCVRYRLRLRSRTIEVEEGEAIHVPSFSDAKFFSPNPLMLMDFLVGGIGRNWLKDPRPFFNLKGLEPDNVRILMPHMLDDYFGALSVEESAIGGSYQLATITERQIDTRVFVPSALGDRATITFKHGTCVITDTVTGQEEYIQDVMDRRWPYEIKESACLL